MTTTTPPVDGTPRRRTLILAICCLSLFMVGMDTTIVNIALPTIQVDLRAGISGLQWTIDAYALVLGSLLILSGSMGDRFGRKRVFAAGLVLFSSASALCALAPSVEWLTAFRALQGVGGSMLNPVALSIISNTFTDDRERARAVGVWAGVFGLSMALGPLVGGMLLGASMGWRSLFWINVPIGILAIGLLGRFVPESKAPHPRGIDPVGQVLVIAMLTGLVFAIIEGPDMGWTAPIVLACMALAVASLAGILVLEPRRAEPLIELRFFRSVPFSGAASIAFLAFAAVGGFALITTLYLQEVRGYSAFQAGLLFVPVAMAAMVVGPAGGRLVANRGARLPLAISGAALTLCAAMLSGVDAYTPVAWLVAAYVAFGVGFGMVSAPVNVTALSGMPRAQSGVAAAIVSTGRQVGQTLGVAVVGSIVSANLRGPLNTGLPSASRPAWLLIAAGGIAVVALGMLTTSDRAGRTASAALAAEERSSEPG